MSKFVLYQKVRLIDTNFVGEVVAFRPDSGTYVVRYTRGDEVEIQTEREAHQLTTII